MLCAFPLQTSLTLPCTDSAQLLCLLISGKCSTLQAQQVFYAPIVCFRERQKESDRQTGQAGRKPEPEAYHLQELLKRLSGWVVFPLRPQHKNAEANSTIQRQIQQGGNQTPVSSGQTVKDKLKLSFPMLNTILKPTLRFSFEKKLQNVLHKIQLARFRLQQSRIHFFRLLLLTTFL